MNEDALKERIRSIAKDKNKTFQEVWKQLLLERFLSRISDSNHQNKFIFKGGLLLAQYLEIGRETVDIDFLMTKIKNETEVIQNAITEIISNERIKDGFTFTFESIEKLSQPHMDYTGFRINLRGQFEKMTDRIQLDLGFGDTVSPDEELFKPFLYKGKPIFEGEITLMVYPIETIFSEKLETIISKGSINSRMKDYHDVILIMREKDLLDIEKLKVTVRETFKNRGTELNLPIEFDKGGIASLQKQWNSHLKKLGKVATSLNLGAQVQDGIDEINAWLTKMEIKL